MVSGFYTHRPFASQVSVQIGSPAGPRPDAAVHLRRSELWHLNCSDAAQEDAETRYAAIAVKLPSSFMGRDSHTQTLPAASVDDYWHALPADAISARLGVDPASGLNDEVAHNRFLVFGPNRLSARKQETVWDIFLEEIREPMIVLLDSYAFNRKQKYFNKPQVKRPQVVG